MHPIASVNRYPWLLDANVTNAWVADPQWIHTPSALPTVDAWQPAKGGVTLPVNSCNWQTGYVAAGGPGYLSPNANGCVVGDTFASAVSGSDTTFSMILVCHVQGAQPAASRLWSFGNTSNSNSLIDCDFTGTAENANFFRRDNAGLIKGSGVMAIGSSPVVLTYLFDGATKKLNSRKNGVAADVNVDFDVSTITLNRLYLLALVGSAGAAVHFSTAYLRALILTPGVLLSSGSYTPIENYFKLEDGIP